MLLDSHVLPRARRSSQPPSKPMRTPLILLALVFAPSVAVAVPWSPQASATPITAPVKSAGTYHLSTGTWTRPGGQVALAGFERLYDNTCSVGLFYPLASGEVALDSGRIPSTSSPATNLSLTGLYDNYDINGFQIAYCSYEVTNTSMDVSFYECYAACLSPGVLPAPIASFNLVGVPGAPAAGSLGCWIMSVDLANTPGIFQLRGDCDGYYDNVPSQDSFGWSWTQTGSTISGGSGPLLAGDPSGFFNASCGGVGAGTTFVGAGAGPGSGIGSLDQFELAGLTVSPGCFSFGGYSPTNPYSAFHMLVQADTGYLNPAGYCFGDAQGVACPCSGVAGHGEGCLNSSGRGAALVSFGSLSQSLDTLGFFVEGVPGSKPGLLLRGDNQVVLPAGDGVLCASGNSLRSQVQVTVGGATTFNDFKGGPFGSVANVGAPTNFQFWYRDPVNTCSGAGFNFTNAVSIYYLP